MCSERSTPIDSVRSLTPAETGHLLPSRWRALVRRAVYQLVKAEDRLGADSRPSCSSPLSPRHNEREELTDDPPKNCELPVRARSVIKHSVTTQDEELIKKLVKEVVNAYTTNSTLIQSKVVERGSRCPRCRSLSKLPTRSAAAKRVSFDCSSLFSTRSEAFGFNGNRHDREDGVFEHVYVVTETERPGGRRPGLVEVPVLPEPGKVEGNPFPDGKRIIRSVGVVEAVSVGFIDCVPADMLIDTGAVASHPTASLKPSRMRLGSACVLPSGSFSATSGSGSSSASSDGDDRDVGGGCVSWVSEFQRAGTAACYLNASGQLRTAAMGLEFDSDEHGSDQVGEHASLSDWGVDSDGNAIYVKRVQNGSTQRMWMTLAIVLDIILCGIYNIATAFSLAERVRDTVNVPSTVVANSNTAVVARGAPGVPGAPGAPGGAPGAPGAPATPAPTTTRGRPAATPAATVPGRARVTPAPTSLVGAIAPAAQQLGAFSPPAGIPGGNNALGAGPAGLGAAGANGGGFPAAGGTFGGNPMGGFGAGTPMGGIGGGFGAGNRFGGGMLSGAGAGAGMSGGGFSGNGVSGFGAQGGNALGGQGAMGNFGPVGASGFTGGQTGAGFGGAAPIGAGNGFGGGFNRL
ncbi:hypothetical protein PF002_g13830 [Phytophthora fragariae]|uniref:Peptidase A2 domain-containing protein n=1 Tax=Phytophthora fragariae TaxID=53985 RepID=A0A6A3Z2N6_9STRA|nr:hypothetical protein PF002_g13830 [Phytophthora fragariae]